jgi:predicted dehydrogenase
MVKVALTGVGFMGKAHLGVYQKLPEVRVTALCDIRPEAMEITSLAAGGNIDASSGTIDLSGTRKHTDYGAMLKDGGFDLVDICLPTHLHADFSIRALEAGFHVFCEKPMALTADEADRMLKKVQQTRKLFTVGQCLRFWPAYTEVKKLLDSGRYGSVRYAELARFSSPPKWASDNWMLDGKRSGNAALDLHIHDVDMVLFLFGVPRSVRSSGIQEPDGTFSHIATQYTYPGRVVASTGGWICSDSFGFNMRAFFVLDEATIELDFSRPQPVVVCPNGGKKEPLPLPPGDGYYHELADFTASVARGRASGVVTAASAADAVKLCFLEIESARTGKEVSVRL